MLGKNNRSPLEVVPSPITYEYLSLYMCLFKIKCPKVLNEIAFKIILSIPILILVEKKP